MHSIIHFCICLLFVNYATIIILYLVKLTVYFFEKIEYNNIAGRNTLYTRDYRINV